MYEIILSKIAFKIYIKLKYTNDQLTLIFHFINCLRKQRSLTIHDLKRNINFIIIIVKFNTEEKINFVLRFRDF